MKNFRYIYWTAMLVLLSCTEPIDIELANSREYLVVEARLEHYSDQEYAKVGFAPNNPFLSLIFKEKLQSISLTKSVNVFGQLNTNNTIDEKDAEVYVIDETNNKRYNFSKTLPGVDLSQLGPLGQALWFSPFEVKTNTKYTLHIITEISGEKRHYVATEQATTNPGIREVTQLKLTDNLLYPDGYYALPVVTGITDDTYLMWDIYHLPTNAAPVYIIPRADNGGSARIRFVDGEATGSNMCGLIVYQYFEGQDRVLGEDEDEDDLPNPTKVGDAMLFKSISLNKENFVHASNIYSAARPNPDVPNGPVFGNIRALNPDGTKSEKEVALGYFSVNDIAVGLRTISADDSKDPLSSFVTGTDLSPVREVCNKLNVKFSGQGGSTRYEDPLFTKYTTTFKPYKTRGDKTLNLRIHQPKGDQATSRRAVFLASGGSFVNINHTSLSSFVSHLTSRGYVVIEPEYSTIDRSQINSNSFLTTALNAAIDYADAVKFAQSGDFAQTYKLDLSKTIIGGYSAGSVAALTLAYLSADDALGDLEPLTKSLEFFKNKITIDAVINVAGGLTSADFITAGEPALYSYHGTLDQTVPYEAGNFQIGELKIPMFGSGALEDSAKRKGHAPNELFTIPLGTHLSPILNNTIVNADMLSRINSVYAKN